MKPLHALKVFLIATLTTFTIATANALDIWLAPRTDGFPGSGTEYDPYDVGTQQKFDALLGSYNRPETPNITFHLAPGTYLTLGSYDNYGFDNWACLSGWKFRGSGMNGPNQTTIKLAGYRYLGDNKHATNYVFSQLPWFRVGIEVTNLTIDCNWTNLGSRLNGSFNVPGVLQTVNVPVANADWAINGKHAYIQELFGARRIVGVYEIITRQGNILTLKNLYPFFGKDTANNLRNGELVTSAAGEVFVGPVLNTCGIILGAKDTKVENVRVTNTGTPHYELTSGIAIFHVTGGTFGEPFHYGDGNVVRGCVVDDMWGAWGAGISLLSNNPDTGDIGNYVSGLVENNRVNGSGRHFGMGCMGAANSVYRNNEITACNVGWFVDTGFNQDILIVGNTFIDCDSGIQFGGGDRAGNHVNAAGNGWSRMTILDNNIDVPNNRSGLDVYGEVKHCLFIGNHILAKPGAESGYGFRMFPLETNRPNANAGNLFAENFVSPQLQNIIPTHVALGYNNTSGENTPFNLGTANSPFVDDIIRASNNALNANNSLTGNVTLNEDSPNQDGTVTLTLGNAGNAKSLLRARNALQGTQYESMSRLARTDKGRGRAATEDRNTASKRVTRNSGTMITVVSNLDLAAVPVDGTSELSVNVPGAAVGDAVALARPIDTPPGIVYDAVVSSVDLVTVRANNYSNQPKDPAPGSFTITVIKP